MIPYYSDNYKVINFANTNDSNEFIDAVNKIKKVLSSCSNSNQQKDTQTWAKNVLIDRFLSKVIYVGCDGFGRKDKKSIRNIFLSVVSEIIKLNI